MSVTQSLKIKLVNGMLEGVHHGTVRCWLLNSCHRNAEVSKIPEGWLNSVLIIGIV